MKTHHGILKAMETLAFYQFMGTFIWEFIDQATSQTTDDKRALNILVSHPAPNAKESQ